MNFVMILGLIRHVLTFLGGYIVAKGIVDEAAMLEIVGAIMTIIGIAASFVDKKNRPDKV